MKIAFAGTSGSGKTTLCEWVAKEFNLKFISGSSGDLKTKKDIKFLLDKYGFKGSAGHAQVIQESHKNPEFGFALQELIRQRRDDLISNSDDFVTDRSPLDNFVFFILQAGLYKDDATANDFLQKCIETTAKLTHIFYLPSMFEKIEDNGSRINIVHYQRSVDGVFNKHWWYLVSRAQLLNPELAYGKLVDMELKERKMFIEAILNK